MAGDGDRRERDEAPHAGDVGERGQEYVNRARRRQARRSDKVRLELPAHLSPKIPYLVRSSPLIP